MGGIGHCHIVFCFKKYCLMNKLKVPDWMGIVFSHIISDRPQGS